MIIDWAKVFAENPRTDEDASAMAWYRRLGKLTDKPAEYVKKIYYTHHYKHSALEKEVSEVGIPVNSVSHYWYKGKHFSIFSKATQKTYFELRDEIVDSMMKSAPEFKPIKYIKEKTNYLLVVDPADIHIGKLAKALETGEEYNVEIAVNRINEGIEGLLNKVSGFSFDRILLIIGNDILHTDNPRRTTTSGTPQDTDGMWFTNFLIAKDIYINIINRLLPIARVSVQYNPSNHDYMSGFFLADTLNSWFSKCKEIDFDITPSHRKYFVYGKNLIGTTHGDGAKITDLPLLMAQEASQYWHSCPYRYWYEHHIHHKRSKEIGSVNVESLRSPSGTDSWHHRNGYQHSLKAIEGFVHDKDNGQIARFTQIVT